MTGRQMQVEFERLIQIINPEYNISKKLDSDTIFYFIRAAQDRFIKQNYLSIDQTRGTYEHLKKNTDAFKSLIKTSDELTPTEVNGKYISRVSIPIDFFLYLRSDSKVNGTYLNISEVNSVWVPNKFITQEDVDTISVSYFNNPILRQPCALVSDDVIDIYHDAITTVNKATITYIKTPISPGVSTNCELSENVHQELVEMAVDIFITEAAYRLGSNPKRQNDKQQ